jgi:hypothetical protein
MESTHYPGTLYSGKFPTAAARKSRRNSKRCIFPLFFVLAQSKRQLAASGGL